MDSYYNLQKPARVRLLDILLLDDDQISNIVSGNQAQASSTVTGDITSSMWVLGMLLWKGVNVVVWFMVVVVLVVSIPV